MSEIKPFSLFARRSGQVTLSDLTNKSSHKLVVNKVTEIRARLLEEEILRQPFLDIFSAVYSDTSNFPDVLKPYTPAADHLPNIQRIRAIRDKPPTDEDVISFLTNAFPDLHLVSYEAEAQGVLWDETLTGRDDAEKEMVIMNWSLIQLWLQIKSTPWEDPTKLTFMFISVFLHELAQNSLVWYGRGACDTPDLGGIGREGGEYLEKAYFGGVSYAEYDQSDPLRILDIGLKKDNKFYTLDNAIAAKLVNLDTSQGLPMLNIETLSPAPLLSLGRYRSKYIPVVGSLK